MKKFGMKSDHTHKRHHHRQPDPYELYELEHMPHMLTEAPSDQAGPQPHHTIISNDYHKTGIEAQPYRRPLEGANRVIFTPNYYESGVNVQPDSRLTPHVYEGECGGDVDCMAEKFIETEHEKFEQSKWVSMKK